MLPYYKDLVMAISLVLLMLVNAATAHTNPPPPQFRVPENGVMMKKSNRDKVKCKTNYVEVSQAETGRKLPSGSSVYSVEISNICPSDCSISQLHINCGSFNSELFIPPTTFKLVGPSDCLVNNGNSIGPYSLVSFQYASSQQFPLSVSSLQCSS